MKNGDVEPLVSVIVPIYNTQEFLPRCLDSMIKQTYENMEMILVDDGSTDGSRSVCEAYAAKDARIRLVSQPNQGIIAAKKAGLGLCRGLYVMFVDSDDWIEPKLLETMVRTIRECDCSMVCTNVSMDTKNSTVVKKNAIPPGIYETDSIAKDLFYYRDMEVYGILPYSVAKLYPKDALQEVLGRIGNEIRYAEDKAIVFGLVFQNRKVCFTDDVYYHYCVRSGSACQSENQDYLVELTAFYKYAKKLFDGHREREHLLRQLGKYLLQESRHAIDSKLGLNLSGESIHAHPFRLDPSALLGQKKKIILYGAGKVGADYQKQMEDCQNVKLQGWVDKNDAACRKKGLAVQPVRYIWETEYDCILVAVARQNVFWEIKKELTQMGIEGNVILWGRPYGAPYGQETVTEEI